MLKSLVLLAMIFVVQVVSAANAGKDVSYMVEGKPYQGYYVAPAKPMGLVLIIHDWDGLGEYEIKRAQMIAALGYAAFAADLFGDGVRPAEVAERQKLTGALYADRVQMRALLQGALEAAVGQAATIKNVVAAGYCFGGAAVLEQARSGAPLKGFVAFHGGLDTPQGQDYSNVKGKVMILHGTADKSVSMESFALLAQSLEKDSVSHEMITYGGAPHAFTVFGSERYREDADKKSWERFSRFLKETLD